MTTAEGLVVRKSITVGLDQQRAFELFTDGIAEWWPSATHSLHGEKVQTVVLEGREGGRMFERTADGEEETWATVLEFDPPNRFVLEWMVNASAPTELAVSFSADGSGTRLELVHSGWDAEEKRTDYDTGWDFVLGRYGERARA